MDIKQAVKCTETPADKEQIPNEVPTGRWKSHPFSSVSEAWGWLKVTNKVRFMDCNLELSAQNNPYNDNYLLQN